MSESVNRTLPLFADLDPAAAGRAEPRQAARSMATPAAARAAVSSDGERHLRAAWRLSRGMWRYPERSAEETRAGIAICRHLRALLAESGDAPK